MVVSAPQIAAAVAAVPAGPVEGSTPAVAEQAEAQKSYGVLEETPNQRRTRLGQPIVASYPPLEYGEAIETPNHRRARLGLPPPEADNYGVTAETPNQRRARLASQTASLQ